MDSHASVRELSLSWMAVVKRSHTPACVVHSGSPGLPPTVAAAAAELGGLPPSVVAGLVVGLGGGYPPIVSSLVYFYAVTGFTPHNVCSGRSGGKPPLGVPPVHGGSQNVLVVGQRNNNITNKQRKLN